MNHLFIEKFSKILLGIYMTGLVVGAEVTVAKQTETKVFLL
jgi:hypothetical protein